MSSVSRSHRSVLQRYVVRRIRRAARSVRRRAVLPSTIYEGSGGSVWFAGNESRAPSIAAYFTGDDLRIGEEGEVPRPRIPDRITEVAQAGGLPVVRLDRPHRRLADALRRSITVPAMIDIHVELPADVETLRSQLLTSTTREDFRRIRRAGFSYRVSRDPNDVREFHAQHYLPITRQRFPGDGSIRSVDHMLRDLERGAELVCADIEGTWVAGMFNVNRPGAYEVTSLGIRNGDTTVRNKRVAAALIVRSLERAVETGVDRATLGRSVPFLGKGSVWFKAKWGGIVSHGQNTRYLQVFPDLRHAAVRRMLSVSPIIHVLDDALVVSAWLEPGEEPLRVTTREAGRYPGISRWYVLGEPATLAAGAAELAARQNIVPVPVPAGDGPSWLGELLADGAG